MTISLAKGTQAELIYNSLLPHEFMKKETIEKKTGLPWTTISGTLTQLRRCGLVEYSGTYRNLRWKRHPIDNPLYPPQKDVIKRKSKKGAERKAEVVVNYDMVMKRCIELAADLSIELQRLKKLDPCKFEKWGEIGGETVYYKAEE